VDTIQGLWWGPMTNLEKLSAASYIAMGHPYHLYTYHKLGGLPNPPAHVVIKDAEEIVPITDVGKFRYYANFADWFRLNLLYQRGGWWCDTDSVCLKPFDFPEEMVLFRHRRPPGQEQELVVFNAHMKFPAGSSVVKFAIDNANKKEWYNVEWEFSLKALAEAVKKFNLSCYPPDLVIPFPWWEWRKELDPIAPEISPKAYAVHMWHTEWTMSGLDRDASYPPTCLYERLKMYYKEEMKCR